MSPERDQDAERTPPSGGLLPPAASPPVLLDEARFEELQRRLRSKESQLRAALKDQEALRLRLAEAVKDLEAAHDAAAQRQREHAASAALSQELAETLRVAAQARAQLSAALAEARRAAAHWQEAALRAGEEKSALAGERDRLAAELGTRKQELVQGQERIAALLKQVDEAGAAAEKRAREADLRREESEKARAQADGRAQGLGAEIARVRSEFAAKEEELDRLKALTLEAAREAAEARVESQRRLANVDVLQHEANEAMDAAAEIKSRSERRLEEQRLAFEEERRGLAAKAEASGREAAELKGELRRRVEAELAQARAGLDSERAALFAAVEAEREKLRSEARARAAAEQARLKAVDQSLQKVESMRAEQSAERARILREVHAELNKTDIPPALPRAKPAPAAPPPSVPEASGSRPWLWAAGFLAAAPLLWWLWTLLP
jgi:hypothetical protein